MSSFRKEFLAHVHKMVYGEPTRKYRITRENLIRSYDTANKRRRIRIFFKLWFANMKSRRLLITNVIYIIPQLPANILSYMEIPNNARKNAFPTSMRMLESPFSSDLATLFHHLLTTKYKNEEIQSIVLRNSRDTIASMILVQAILSLIQTVLELRFHDARGRQERKMLNTMAGKLGIRKVSSLNIDQLRVMIAQQLMAEAKK